MAVLLYLVVLVAIAVGLYFFYKQRGCAFAVCSKKTDAAEPTAPRTAQPPTEVSSVRKRNVASVLKTAVSSNSKASDYLDPNVPPLGADGKPVDAVVGGVDPLASVNDKESAPSSTRTAIAGVSTENTVSSTASSNSSLATATTSGTNVDKKKKKSKRNKSKKSTRKRSKNTKPKEMKQEA